MRQLLIIITFALLLGCAGVPLTHDQCNATKFPTAMEHEQCLRAASEYEQEQHEKEDRRLIKRDKLIVFLNACDASPNLVLGEKQHMRSRLPNDREIMRARREYGYPYTHDNVHRHAIRQDFVCVNPRDIVQQIEQWQRRY